MWRPRVVSLASGDGRLGAQRPRGQSAPLRVPKGWPKGVRGVGKARGAATDLCRAFRAKRRARVPTGESGAFVERFFAAPGQARAVGVDAGAAVTTMWTRN